MPAKGSAVKRIKEYLLITIGSILVAFSVQVFFLPNGIAPGGVSGMALVLNLIVPGLSVSVLVMALNAVFFGLGFLVLGGGFGIKTLYASTLVSVAMWVIETFLSIGQPTEDLMLSTAMGILILGTGIGIVFNQDASTGGTDIIAKIISKFTGMTPGSALVLIDLTVVVMIALNFGLERGLYGILGAILNGVVINRIVDGFNSAKQVFVITRDREKVRGFIVGKLDRGATIFSGEGAYTGAESYMIYCVLSTREFVVLKQFLRDQVPDAFVTVGTAAEVLGKGFSSPKVMGNNGEGKA